MTGCASTVSDHSLNCITFRAGIRLCKGKLATLKVLKLGPKHTSKHVQSRPFIRSNTKPKRLATPSAEPN
jgi:hypothetical protein